MALTPIIKGMADGAEAIQANFAAIGITETGSNANGTYVKLSDGTMICHGHIDLGLLNMQSPWGALFISAWVNITFPATFISKPYVDANMENDTGDGAMWMGTASTTSTGTGRFVRATALTFQATASWTAIGRWK